MERCGNGFPGLLHQYSAQQAPRADQPQDIGRKPAEINQTNAQDWHQPQRECATNENWCAARLPDFPVVQQHLDRKSTRLNSSHQIISYAVFRLKKKHKKGGLMPIFPTRRHVQIIEAIAAFAVLTDENIGNDQCVHAASPPRSSKSCLSSSVTENSRMTPAASLGCSAIGR